MTTNPGVYTELSKEEKKELSACKSVVTRHLKSFLTAGKALHVINTKALYRDEAGTTFEEYVKTVFGFNNRQSAYRFINAYLVVDKLKSLGFGVLPDRESQCRHLTTYLEGGDKELIDLWDKVIARMQDDGIGLTAPLIKSVITAKGGSACCQDTDIDDPNSTIRGTTNNNNDKGTNKASNNTYGANKASEEAAQTTALLRAALKASQDRTKQAQERASKLTAELNKIRRDQQGGLSKYKDSGLYKELLKAGYKTLSKTMHSDKGGSDAQLKALNALYADLNK